MNQEQRDKGRATKAAKAAEFAKQTVVINEHWQIIRSDELNWEIQENGKFRGFYGRISQAFDALPDKMLDSEAKNSLADVQRSQKGILETIEKAFSGKLTVIAILFLIYSTASAIQVIDLGDLGDTQSFAFAINDAGQITGQSGTAEGDVHVFLWDQGVMFDMSELAGIGEATGQDINNRGQIATELANGHSAILRNSTIFDLSIGGVWSRPLSINDYGQVAGFYAQPMGYHHAFLYDRGNVIPLGPFGAEAISIATGINNLGEITGDATDSFMIPYRVFRYSNGVMQYITDVESYAYGINNHGDICGEYLTNLSGSTESRRARYSTVKTAREVEAIDEAKRNQGPGKELTSMEIRGSSSEGNTGGLSSESNRSSESSASPAQNLFRKGGDVTCSTPKRESTNCNAAPTSNPSGAAAFHAFIWSNGTLTDIGSENSGTTAAMDINDAGQAVGVTYVIPDTCSRECFEEQHAFFYEKGTLTDLNRLLPPGSEWTLTIATGINAQGRICGYGLKNGLYRAFLVIP